MSFEQIASFCADCDIKYEMRCRNVTPEIYTIEGRCAWWAKQLKKESGTDPSNSVIKSYLSPDKDLDCCEKLVNEFTEDCSANDTFYNEVIAVRLGFLLNRLKRIATESAELLTYKENFISKVETLIEKLEIAQYKVWKTNHMNPPNHSDLTSQAEGISLEVNDVPTPSKQPINCRKDDIAPVIAQGHNPEKLDFERPFPSTSHVLNNNMNSTLEQRIGKARFPRDDFFPSRSPPQLYKWGLKFTGDDEGSASCFLQRVADYARSRHVEEFDLLNSISDLLDGSALKWYRRKRESFLDYQDFVKRFLNEFEPLLQTDHLLEFLRDRKQKSSESIVQYISYMEDQFLRLPRFPLERERVKIIRSNLLPKFIRALALVEFKTVDCLEEACRKIELSEAQARANSNDYTYNSSHHVQNFLNQTYRRSNVQHNGQRFVRHANLNEDKVQDNIRIPGPVTNYKNFTSYPGNNKNFQSRRPDSDEKN